MEGLGTVSRPSIYSSMERRATNGVFLEASKELLGSLLTMDFTYLTIRGAGQESSPLTLLDVGS